MHYNQLGKSGLSVSAVSPGTAPLGGTFGTADESDAIAAGHRALDAASTSSTRRPTTAPGWPNADSGTRCAADAARS